MGIPWFYQLEVCEYLFEKTEGEIGVNYFRKGQNWIAKFNAGKCSEIEVLVVSEDGCYHKGKDRVIQPDFVYCQLQTKGENDMEFTWRKGDEQKLKQKAQLVIKNQKKLVCILGKEEAYGFGFGTKEDEGIMLYLRIGSAAVLMYSDSDSGAVSVMFGAEAEHPEKLDGLVNFMNDRNGKSEDENNRKESGCC